MAASGYTRRGLATAMILVVALALLGRSSVVAEETAEERLMQWALSEGAEMRVTIGLNAHGVRGLITTEDVKKDQVLLNIPEHIIFSVRNAPAAETAPQLLKEMHSGCSRLAPYLAVLPKANEVLTGYNWPEEYIPFLASDALVSQVRESFKRHTQEVWNGKLDDSQEMTLREAVGNADVTLDEFQLAVSVITSRTFQTRKAALSMVPIADMANHHPVGDSDIGGADFADKNFRFVAGRDFAKGEEITISYGDMRNDDLLLYYGFVDDFTQPPRLCVCDHRAYVLFEVDSDSLPKEDLTGPYTEVMDELPRLRGILGALDLKLKELGPIPQTLPYVAQLLTRFHSLRRAALVHEVARLEHLLKEL